MLLARRAVAAAAICSIFAVDAHADDAALRAEIDALRGCCPTPALRGRTTRDDAVGLG